MLEFDDTEVSGPRSKVLIVDDNPISVASLQLALSQRFAVNTAESGESCLEWVEREGAPDLILLDIEMGGIDGYETCRRLRAAHDVPVIFVSSHDELEERLLAFDSGGNDFVLKPFDPEVVKRKVERLVADFALRRQLAADKDNLQNMAMGFLRNIGDTGVLLAFMRSCLGLVEFDELARRLVEATGQYGVDCHVQIRHPEGVCTYTDSGRASPLEESILRQSATMGRIFQFRRRLVVNYDYVSVLILNVPDDEGEVGKLRDNIAILAESAEAIAETIVMRRESGLRADALQAATFQTVEAVEALREVYRKQQYGARLRLQEMTDAIEKSYINLGLTESQEARVSNLLRVGADRTLELFDMGIELENRFVNVMEILQPKLSTPRQLVTLDENGLF